MVWKDCFVEIQFNPRQSLVVGGMDVRCRHTTAIIKWTCPYEVAHDIAKFSGKHSPPKKKNKDNESKWANNKVFWVYWKIWSLISTEFIL